MKIIIVRHAEPNYEIDSLTEKGFREAELLADRMCKLDIKATYLSPLGRAQATAKPFVERMQLETTTYDWLREFEAPINRPDVKDKKKVTWDWLPEDWTTYHDFYDYDKWYTHPLMLEGHVYEEYKRVCDGLDEVLKKHGYVRNGRYYDVVDGNNDTIVFVCHFGAECVLLSHLLTISPMQLWHGFCALPSSVTTVATEERRQGKASFRTLSFGDISHLYVANEEPSFSARFVEKYGNEGERVD